MAILKGARGIEVEVVCDAQALQEYNDPDVEEIPRVVTRYIEARTGNVFAIRCKFKNNTRFRGDTIVCHVTVDGTWIGGALIDGNFKDAEVVRDINGAYVSASRKVPLLFSNLLIASDSNSDSLNGHEDVGIIKVRLTHENKGRKVERQPCKDLEQRKPAMLTEKCVKGRSVSHGVEFGASFPVTPSLCYESTPVAKDSSVGTYIFHYRSRESLKGMLLIPRSPSPPPIEMRKPGDLNHEEIQELQRRIMSRDSEVVRIKRERTGEPDSRSRKRVKASDGPSMLELLDDETFREIKSEELLVPKQEIIDLD